MRHRTYACALIGLCVAAGGAFAQGDPEVIAKIVEEGKNNSQVWQHLLYLSEDIGTRLTGSTGMIRANAWTRDQFAAYGLHNAYLEKVGEIPVRFDRGACSAGMVEPVEHPFEFTASAWSAGTNSPVRGPVVKEPATLEEFETVKESLAGAWVLSKERSWRRGGRRRGQPSEEEIKAREEREQLRQLISEAGIAGRMVGSRGETVRTGAGRGWREMSYDDLPTDVSLTIRRSDYDAMNSRIADGESVVAEVDLQHHFVEGPFPIFNTVAEIPGTEFPEQVVIFGGHLDTWDGPGTQGTQDNGTGCAVALEVARIFHEVGIQPRRTIRFILFVGEEQGFFGSRGHLENLSDEEKANISAVFVEDGGTNYEGSLSCVEPMAEMLRTATAPVNEAFPDMPVEINVGERMRGGGSDHAPFIREGIPGFFWGEHGIGGREGKDYRFIHHTQNDTVRYAIEEYLVQSATCSAITVYNLAMADTLLPREVREERQPEPEEPGEWKPAEGPLSGAWDAELFMGEGDDDDPIGGFTFHFEMNEEGRVRGRLESDFITGRLRDVVFNKETGDLSFTLNSERGRSVYKAKVEGDAMAGTIVVSEDFTMRFKAKRAKPEAEGEAKEEPKEEPESEGDG